MDTVADLNVKTYENGEKAFVSIWGAALDKARIYRWLSLFLGVLLVGQFSLDWQRANQPAAKPLVIRIDQVGRAEAVAYDAATWKPQTPELRYFLTRFVTLHYSRSRATIRRDYPSSLMFLSAGLSSQLMSVGSGTAVEQFAQSGAEDEIEVEVSNVSFIELKAAPYRASVDFVKHLIVPNTRQERKTETFTAQIDFTLLDSVPNAFIPVNPLGVQVTHIDVSQAFQ